MKDILGYVDHTVLKQTATWEDVKTVCEQGVKNNTASVCIPPCYVKKAKEFVGKDFSVCTVIGFPNGNNSTDSKIYETKSALKDGADEIDMVINIGMLKAGEYDYVLNEIKEIKSACGDKILKVIIETCLLTDEEKIKMCKIVSQSGADYIKTSTGFGGGGATVEDVELMVKNVSENVKVKASGGISGMSDAEKFIELGASRLGTSRLI